MLDLDTSVPALLVRTGAPMWDYGALATARTLGRLGIPVFVLSVRGEPELWSSRYVTAVVGSPLSPHADVAEQVAALNSAVSAIGAACVAIAGDDESAVLLAEQREAIDGALLSAPVSPQLPRRLSDKVTLGEVARMAGVPYPRYIDTDDPARLDAFAAEVGFPLIAKSPAPYARLTDQTVSRTTLITEPAGMLGLREAAQEGHRVFLQQYLMGPGTQTWYAAGVRAPFGQGHRVWTGQKLVAHPGATGVGVLNVARAFPELADHVSALCESLDYTGPFDTDWIVNRERETLHLIDFNPRRGAQFRTFRTDTGLDVVRATHLALTRREIDWGQQIMGIVHTVENLAVLHGPGAWPWSWQRMPREPVEYSWLGRDDRAPSRFVVQQTVRRAGRKLRAKIGPG